MATFSFTACGSDGDDTDYAAILNTLNGGETTGEAIDLGLPSGIKWASYNVGATVPEEYGGYYAWGETEEKSNYEWSTYKYCNGSYTSLTKYCTSSSYGTVDNKTILEPEDDVAHVKWGGSWRMSTLDEIKELDNNGTWTWSTLNGVNGYRVTGPNGNSIIPPTEKRWAGCVFYIGVCDSYLQQSRKVISASGPILKSKSMILAQGMNPLRVANTW